MKNITLLLWIMLGTFIYIECRGNEWLNDPWYGKNFHEQWAKALEKSRDDSSESKDTSEEESSENEESESNSESILNFSSDLFEDPPDTWPCLYKDCRGKQQSPINIDTEAITIDENLGPLKFENYDKPLSDLVIKNAGFTVAIFVPPSAKITVTSNWLSDTYRLFGITFTFGAMNKNGSVHAVDSKHYPFEIISIFLNTKYNKLEYKPGAVLYVNTLYKVGKESKALNNITESLPDIKELDSNTTLKSAITVKNLFPKFPEQYITYNGSLTLPPCTEGQKVVVFHYFNTISQKQLNEFRKLNRMKEGRDLGKEERSLQPLNGRKILSSKNGHEEKDWWDQQSFHQYWR